MIYWPVIVHYSGDNELLFCASQAAWNNDADLHAHAYNPQDRLIDSNGQIFSLTERQDNRVVPLSTDQTIHLEAVNGLVRLHASALGQCCVQKIFFNSIAQAIKAVEFLSDA